MKVMASRPPCQVEIECSSREISKPEFYRTEATQGRAASKVLSVQTTMGAEGAATKEGLSRRT